MVGGLSYQRDQDGGGGRSKRPGFSEQSVGRGVRDRVVRVVGVITDQSGQGGQVVSTVGWPWWTE